MFKERIKTHHSAMSTGKKYMLGMSSVNQVLAEENQSARKDATIYIHVPFCNKICSFCNMQRSLSKPSENYADLVIKEIENYAKLPYIKTSIFDAVYFGGGTPTTLLADSLCRIIEKLKEKFHFTSNTEFTIETTVTELSADKMKHLVKAGCNRFSVGVQTFDDKGRKLMGRIGSGQTAYDKLLQLKQFSNVTVSMDLIYNYQGQTMESLQADLDKIVTLNLDGFSMYSLINMKKASIAEAQDEKNDERMFLHIANRMKQEGYHFLELTKMVKKDQYRYIMNRHRGADTLPLGAGAGGSINNLAMMNPIGLSEYERSITEFDHKTGMLFMPEYQKIVRFKGDIQAVQLPKEEELYQDKEAYLNLKEKLILEGMIDCKKGEYFLTEKGIFWGNTISRELSAMI